MCFNDPTVKTIIFCPKVTIVYQHTIRISTPQATNFDLQRHNVASYSDILWAHHAIFVSTFAILHAALLMDVFFAEEQENCVTSPKDVCVGDLAP